MTMYQKQITRDEIQTMPLRQFEGRIEVINFRRDINKIIPYLTRQRLLGFDTETRPAFRKGQKNKVALLQLSTADIAFLIRINRVGLPKELLKILASPEIIKVGAAIRDDIKALRKRNEFKPAGFVELQKYVNQFGIESNAIKKMAAIVLGCRISKRQQLSNWENDELSEAQQRYAATDAWVCYEIYRQLEEENSNNNQMKKI